MQKNNHARSHHTVPLEMGLEAFRQAGHRLVDQIAEFLATLPERPVTTGESPYKIRKLVGESTLPQHGADAGELLENAAHLLFDHSLFNGHPKFMGYITSSAAPIGILADMLAAAVNPNVGAWVLSPVASEIEQQAIQWIAEIVGYPSGCSGVLVSGGNMANFVGFLAARQAKAGWDIRKNGLLDESGSLLRVYASAETHTWLHKATDISGIGTGSIRWIPTDTQQRMDTGLLCRQIQADLENGERPFMVIGAAGTVSTGAIDPLPEIAEICREFDLWFHVDGAYGAFAAVLPDAPEELTAMREADSIALDPHKWLYAPLEAGCALVKDGAVLRSAFSYRPPYYKFDEIDGEPAVSFVDYGPQNSRGFRALKVWLALKQAGRSGYQQMISNDIELAAYLFQLADAHPELEAVTHNLSITTFRYLPEGFNPEPEENADYLNQLNTEILTRLQADGEAFVSNAVIDGTYVLRACVVNFRTSHEDMESLPDIITRIGRTVDGEMRGSKK